LKAVRGKLQVAYRGKFIRMIADFSTETGVSVDILQAPKEDNYQFQLLYPTKLFIIEGEIKTFHTKQKLKKFMTSNAAPQKIFNGILHTDKEDKSNKENTRKNKFH
jgi:hypothetical protein